MGLIATSPFDAILVSDGEADQGEMSGDLARWLSDLGLGGHAEAFAANHVDWDILPDLSEDNLKELGLSLGDRKRLLKAVAALKPPSSGARADAAPKPREAERRPITVMFVDLVDSTPLSERLDPEDMREVLRGFHTVCAKVIEAHDGHIARYMGDGILVYFGYPQAHEDDAARAVHAGLGILVAMGPANDRLEAEYGVRLHLRIGAHTGLVVVGEVGAGPTRDSQAVVGETPNVAARLQGEALPDTLVISPATRRLVEGLFTFEDLGPRALKGVSGALRVYRVVGEGETIDRFDVRARRGLTPLVGRAAELEMLRIRWTQACDGEMRCVLLVGDPGIGKSRTLRSFRDSLVDTPHEVITLYCSPYHRNSAFSSLVEWLCRALRLDPKGNAGGAMLALESAVTGLGLDAEEAMPQLAALLGLPDSDRLHPIDTSAASFKRRVLDTVVALVAAMARRQPVLLLVEDAHWIDPSTLQLVQELQEQLAAARLLLLITARPEFRPAWTYPQFVQINLDRLSRRDRTLLVERMTGGKPLPDFVLEQIIDKTDGIPLFVEELTKTVLEGELLRDAGNRYELAGPFKAIAIPDTLQGSLLARLDRLDAEARELAQIGATIGREFGHELLAIVANKPAAQLDAMLERLVAADIVLPASRSAWSGGAHIFRHALIQEAAYQSLLLARRREYHAAIGVALGERFPEIAGLQPELVAQHLTAAGLAERAIDYWLSAGVLAERRSSYVEATAHLHRGLQLARGLPADERERSRRALPLLLALGTAEVSATTIAAWDHYREAAAIARQLRRPADMAEAALGFEEAALYLGKPMHESIGLLEEAIAACEPGQAGETIEPIVRCRLVTRLARALHSVGAYERAHGIIEQAMPLARKLGDKRSIADCLTCTLLPSSADPLAKLSLETRASMLKEMLEFAGTWSYADLHHNASALLYAHFLEIGDLGGFRTILELHKYGLADGGSPLVRWLQYSGEALAAILCGDFPRAERKATEALELLDGGQVEFTIGPYGVQMFTIRREQGRLAEVAPLFKRFVDENPENSTWRPGLMLIACDLGFEEQARRTLSSMAAEGFNLPVDGKRAVTLSYLAEACARLGEVDHAARVYELLLPYDRLAITMPAATICCGAAARYLGMLAATLENWSAAERHFEDAMVMNERMEAWPWLAHTRHEYAQALLDRGRVQDMARARELLGAAIATAERLGMASLLDRARGTAAQA